MERDATRRQLPGWPTQIRLSCSFLPELDPWLRPMGQILFPSVGFLSGSKILTNRLGPSQLVYSKTVTLPSLPFPEPSLNTSGEERVVCGH